MTANDIATQQTCISTEWESSLASDPCLRVRMKVSIWFAALRGERLPEVGRWNVEHQNNFHLPVAVCTFDVNIIGPGFYNCTTTATALTKQEPQNS